MNREQLERAKVVTACIDVAERNIAVFEEIKSANEIQIRKDGHTNPVYITGKQKDRIMDLLIEDQRIFRDKHLNEFAKI